MCITQFCEIAVVNAAAEVVHRDRCDTTIPALLRVVEAVARPRLLVIEEGPLAGWLWRGLHDAVERLVVSEPRRNRLIAEGGDKDDDLDAEKLAQLLRGGFIKEVHQVESLERAVFKQHVAVYHFRVRQRVRESQRLTSLFRQHGAMICEKAYVASADRPALLERLPANRRLREAVQWLWRAYDQLVDQEETWRKRLVQWAQKEEVVRRFAALPGISWIRAATWYAYLDTPWRFRSKAALWKYLGIGLERERSGNGPEHVGVPLRTHRLQDDEMLYIDPVECIDCEACVPECPVEAIFHENNVPQQWTRYVQLNSERSASLIKIGHITDKQSPKEGSECIARKV
jgi:ferredoxin